MGEQAPNMTKDYASSSLDEYIRDKASEFKDLMRKNRRGELKGKFSQQWRFGRNGSRRPKRLVRYGPLRPVNVREPFQGLPKLVMKRYARLPETSVFHRLGWSPLFTVARHKLRQARECVWRRQFNFVPRRYMMSHPMTKRPMFFPHYRQNIYPQNMWGRWNYSGGSQNYYRPCPPNYSRPNFQTPICSNDDLIKADRLRIAQRALHQVQKTYQQEQPTQQAFYQAESDQYNQAGHNPFLQWESQQSDLPGSSRALAARYPIAKDAFIPTGKRVRPPSPVGSVISQYHRHATANNQNQHSASQQHGRNPFVTNSGSSISFRPTPNVTHIPITQQFAGAGSDMWR